MSETRQRYTCVFCGQGGADTRQPVACHNCKRDGMRPAGPYTMTLVIEHLDTPWQIASVYRAPRGGGWPSVAALQEANVLKTWHPPKAWTGRGDRAVLHPTGVLLEKWQVDAACWMPYTRLSLEN